MCIPPTQSDRGGDTATRSILGIGVLMLLACLAGPLLTGAIGAGALIGAVALCAAVPAIVAVRHRRRTD